jgi:hypothetical protein
MAVSQVVDITAVKNFVVFTLAATDTWAGALDDPKYGGSTNVDSFITAAILNVDGAIVRAIMENPNHPKRSAYLTSTAVTNGNLIGEHVGPIGDVRVDSNLAIEADPEDIRRWARNSTLFGSQTGYFGVAGERLFFLGTAATVDLCTYTRTSACQAPSEYTMVETHLTLASLAKLGGDFSLQEHHLRLAALELQSIPGAMDMLPAVLKELDK